MELGQRTCPRPLLPVRIHPRPTESLAGFLTRTAAANFMPAIELARRVGLDRPSSMASDHSLKLLTAETGLSYETLRSMAYIRTETTVRRGPKARLKGFTFGTVLLPIVDIETSHRRVCRACIAADPYHRSLWDLRLLDACPVHGTPIQSICHTCGHRLTWNGTRLDHCGRVDCGERLPAHEGRVPDPILRAAAYLADLVYGRAHEIHLLAGLTPAGILEVIRAAGKTARIFQRSVGHWPIDGMEEIKESLASLGLGFVTADAERLDTVVHEAGDFVGSPHPMFPGNPLNTLADAASRLHARGPLYRAMLRRAALFPRTMADL